MKFAFRLILFIVILLWTVGTFYECLISIVDSLTYGYPFVKKTYSLVCHQDPTKLIDISCGKSFVCARCSGIYFGLLVNSGVFLFFIPRIKRSLEILLIASIPMFIDVVFTTINIYSYSKTLAFVTGFLFGSVLFLYLYDSLENLIAEIQNR